MATKKFNMTMVKTGKVSEKDIHEIMTGVMAWVVETVDKSESFKDLISNKGKLDRNNEEDREMLIGFGNILDGIFKRMTTPAAYKWFINNLKEELK